MGNVWKYSKNAVSSVNSVSSSFGFLFSSPENLDLCEAGCGSDDEDADGETEFDEYCIDAACVCCWLFAKLSENVAPLFLCDERPELRVLAPTCGYVEGTP